METQTESTLEKIYSRIGKIRTRDNMPIRSRVVQIEELFVNMIDIDVNDSLREEYYDVFHKIFHHLNSYLEFQKNIIKSNQTHIFSFPDDVAENIKSDIAYLDLFFIKATVEDEPMNNNNANE